MRFFPQGLLAALLLALLSSVAEARLYDEIIESGYIEIAVYNDFPPYSYLDAGEPRGIDIEVGKLIAVELGVKPRWFWFNPGETLDDDLRNAVWKGHYLSRHIADLMMRVPYDPEFSRLIDGYGFVKNDMVVMFGPYQRERWWIARDPKQTGDIRTLANFQYLDIGVEIDTLPDFYLTGAFAGRLRDRVKHFINVFDATEKLKQGELAAVVGTRSQIEWGLSTRPDLDLSSDGLEQVGHQAWDIGLAVRHNFRQLAYAIEEIVLNLVNRGDLAEIFRQHNLSYEKPAAYQ